MIYAAIEKYLRTCPLKKRKRYLVGKFLNVARFFFKKKTLLCRFWYLLDFKLKYLYYLQLFF